MVQYTQSPHSPLPFLPSPQLLGPLSPVELLRVTSQKRSASLSLFPANPDFSSSDIRTPIFTPTGAIDLSSELRCANQTRILLGGGSSHARSLRVTVQREGVSAIESSTMREILSSHIKIRMIVLVTFSCSSAVCCSTHYYI